MLPFKSTRQTPFVGRQDELRSVVTWMEGAAAGEGRAVLIAGEPGVGKTRFLAEAGNRARARGFTVLAGRCYESEGVPAYIPFVEALRAHVSASPLDLLRAQLAEGAAEVAKLVPELSARLLRLTPGPALSPDHERYRLFDAVADFLSNLATGTPPGLLLLFGNHEIAQQLVLSVRTVERHVTNLYSKIGARGKADATVYAMRHGLISG
ncbi:MAG: hypothetical protein QOF51_103 [Chloroflexota bacterium]|jgi:predicted ATPase|nr:hypothetical protein [Chloroflexota bacterium]